MKKFDVLIIGSGMGGLVCGNILAKEGYSVCIVEKNKQIGGCLQIYVRDRVIFDSGVHYIGGLEKGQTLYQIFKYLGLMEKLSLEKMDPGFDRVLIEGDSKEYRIMQGYEAFEKELVSDFPDEKAAIRLYIDSIRETCDAFPLYRLRNTGDPERKEKAMSLSAKIFIDSVTNNKTLRSVLAGNNMLYAGSGESTPFYVHALTVNSYIESAWRCLNGGAQIAKHIARNITACGGLVLKNKEVKKLIVEDNRITAALLQDGTFISADHFVSNITPAATFKMVDSVLVRPVTRKRIEAMPHTISSFIVNIVLKRKSFPYVKHNFYYQKDSVWAMDNYSEDNWPLGYGMFLTPDESGEFADGMTIFAYMRYEEVLPWAATYNTVADKKSRGLGYESFKERKMERLLAVVEQRFPDLRESILHSYTSTPLTFRDYIGNGDGNLYGSAKDYKNPLGTLVSAKTRIPNLFLTGQYLNLHGILGTAISGLISCIQLTGKDDFIEKIKNA